MIFSIKSRYSFILKYALKRQPAEKSVVNRNIKTPTAATKGVKAKQATKSIYLHIISINNKQPTY